MLLLIDNYDSFTYNLTQYFLELRAELAIYRNDQINLNDIEKLAPTHLVISPGPGRPEDAGITLGLIQRFAGRLPILGVCLGHQAIAQSFGGKVVHAEHIMHGKTSSIKHNEQHVFSGLPNPLNVTRYHSLMVDKKTLPECLEITAWVDENASEIMAIQHRQWPIYGVQFHPESILTECGHQLLNNFLLGKNLC